MLVCLLYLMLERPLIVFSLINTEGFALLIQRQLVVAELETVVVVPALLLDT